MMKHGEEEVNTETPKFEHEPQRFYCPKCKKTVLSEIVLESSLSTFLLSFFLLFILGWISILVIPFVWTILQKATHYCPICRYRAASKRRIGLQTVKQDVVTVRFGNCAVVLSRRYVCTLVVITSLIFAVSTLRWYFQNVGLEAFIRGPTIEAEWRDFLSDCGMRTSFGNPIKATETFNEKYQLKTVNWRGRLNRISEGIFSKDFIYIDMVPSQFRAASMADLALMFDAKLRPNVKGLNPGDGIKFETTLIEIGKRGKPHYGVVWNITRSVEDDANHNQGLSELFAMLEPLALFRSFGDSVQQRVISGRDAVSIAISPSREPVNIYGRIPEDRQIGKSDNQNDTKNMNNTNNTNDEKKTNYNDKINDEIIYDSVHLVGSDSTYFSTDSLTDDYNKQEVPVGVENLQNNHMQENDNNIQNNNNEDTKDPNNYNAKKQGVNGKDNNINNQVDNSIKDNDDDNQIKTDNNNDTDKPDDKAAQINGKDT